MGVEPLNQEEPNQEEEHIQDGNPPDDVTKLLLDPYNLEMLEKSIRTNKIEIFPIPQNLTKVLCLDK